MWFLKAFFTIVLVAALLYVALLNSGQQVNIFLLDPNVPTVPNVELPVALLASFVLGALVWFFVSLFQVLTARSEVAALRRRTRELTRELTDLRNMSVRDLDPDAIANPSGPEVLRPGS
jgi:uncharacterized integral membrane protein